MGAGIAQRPLVAGHAVDLWDRTRDPVHQGRPGRREGRRTGDRAVGVHASASVRSSGQSALLLAHCNCDAGLGAELLLVVFRSHLLRDRATTPPS